MKRTRKVTAASDATPETKRAPASRRATPAAKVSATKARPASATRATPKAKPASKRTPPAPRAPREGASSPELLAQIRDLERELDRLIDRASHHDVSALADAEEHDDEAAHTEARAPSAVPAAPASEPTPVTPVAPVARTVPDARASGPLPAHEPASEPGGTVFDSAREIVGAEFYRKKWGREALRNRTEDVDDFGYDPEYDRKLRPVLDFLYARWFRVETTGIDHVPAAGRAVMVANHSGTVPFDGVMLKTALLREHPQQRHLRWLTEDFIQHFPFLGGAMNRLGAVRACQENAERLLANEELVAVFPEGLKGIGKLFADRYRLQRFGRGGFVKLALRSRAPLVPVAIVGAEETNPLLFRVEYLSKALGLPYVPVTPTFPALGPLGLLPAPTKWRITVGEPIDLSSYGEGAAEDDLLVGRVADRVRATIQGMLDRELAARKSVFFG